MSPSQRPAVMPMVMALAYVLLVASLELVRFAGLEATAGRTLGLYFDQLPVNESAIQSEGLLVRQVVEGGPADRAGLRPGDRLVRIDGREITSTRAYQEAAEDFRRNQPIEIELRREGRAVRVEGSPGVPVPWRDHILSLFVVLTCLTLGLLALYRRGSDLRARLVAAFSFLLAVELALPSGLLTDARLQVLSHSLFLLVTGIQMAVELHLASIVPTRPAWLKRRPWVVVGFYAVGLGSGFMAWLTYLVESGVESLGFLGPAMPWTYAQLEVWIFELLMPIWALAVPGLLAVSAFRHREHRAQAQAGLILLGVLPWTIYVLWGSGAGLLGGELPLWVESLFPLIVLAFPVGIFVSIYRYHLFDIELVVRRTFLYTALISTLILAFYLAAGTLGLLFSKVTGNVSLSIWTVSGAMFLVGLTFAFLRKELQRVIDRFLFPEHQALRRQLVHLASELPAQGNVTAMGQHLVQRLGDIFGVQAASLLLSDAKSGLFFTVASSNREAQSEISSLSFLVKPDDPVLQRLSEAGEPLPAGRLLDRSPVLAQRLRDLEAQLLVPLLSHQHMVGVLVLGRRQGRMGFSREHRDLLSLIGHQIATAFENIRLFESATFESLTGLRRREAIVDLLKTEIDRARRYERPLVVGMADLDAFKSVNDRYGHLAGDEVLKRVAEVLASGLRSTDVVGRYGGEEFLLVLPETRLEGGLAVADKLRQQVERLYVPMDDGSRVNPRISIGLAELKDLEPGSEALVQLIENADRALYRAKSLGRNRVEPYTPDEEDPEAEEEPSGSHAGLRA